jgi:hypothetical protein
MSTACQLSDALSLCYIYRHLLAGYRKLLRPSTALPSLYVRTSPVQVCERQGYQQAKRNTDLASKQCNLIFTTMPMVMTKSSAPKTSLLTLGFTRGARMAYEFASVEITKHVTLPYLHIFVSPRPPGEVAWLCHLRLTTDP